MDTPKKDKVNFNLWIPADEHHELKTVSEKTGMSMTRIVRDGAIIHSRDLVRRLSQEQTEEKIGEGL
jgi:hypothetical protein